MTTFKRSAFAAVLACLALCVNSFAQTPPIEVTADGEQVEFSAQGVSQKVHIEVFSPSGELVFETDDSAGRSLRWGMVDRKGERVPDGVYLATITVTDLAGKRRKRIEQVTVSSPQYAAQAADAPQAAAATTGAGTTGRVAKWTTSTNLGNSVISESGGKVGVGTAVAPTATLQVNGAQPAASASNGLGAGLLLQTTGGKGGSTTGTTGQQAGAGAAISLLAGNGGDAPAGGKRGNGGNVVIQPGAAGAGAGAAGANGNVLLAPSGVGNVGIGTHAPAQRLHLSGPNSRLRLTSTDSGQWTVTEYQTNNRIWHTGVGGSTVFNDLKGKYYIHDATAGADRLVIDTGGRVTIGGAPSSSGKLNVNADGLSYNGVIGNGYANGAGVWGSGDIGHGVFGRSQSRDLSSGIAGITGYNVRGGWAGYFTGPVRVAGALSVTGGCTGCTAAPSDRALKANLSAVDPRAVLDRLASLPVKEWSYKSDGPSVRHLGPMAQDFRAAFNLGADDKHIDLIDASGVTMAAIQGLYQQNKELAEKSQELAGQNKELAAEVRQLRARMARQQEQLNRINRTLNKRGKARR